MELFKRKAEPFLTLPSVRLNWSSLSNSPPESHEADQARAKQEHGGGLGNTGYVQRTYNLPYIIDSPYIYYPTNNWALRIKIRGQC